MNRIYLKPRKNQKDAYWVKDILDGKKLGKLKIKNSNVIFKIKNKYKDNNLETEARLSANCFQLTWQGFWSDFVKHFNQGLADTKDYDFQIYAESCRLNPCENDMFDRPTLLHPAAKKAWEKMKNAALNDKIDLQIVSAYRSLDYQKQLINNKLEKGIDIKKILKVNTLPGYSEHHTGCAIDIGCENEPVLEEEFDQSAAFDWLTKNAKKFDFYMTYPKGNTTGICYEPWHWCFKPD